MDPIFFIFVIVGFLAQIVDGTLGMGYGVISTSVLLGAGIPPGMASASVHASEIFTTGTSGLFHVRFGNVDRSLFSRLVIPGVLGGIAGAYVLSSVDGKAIKPFISTYLLIMGVIILLRAFRKAGTGDPGKRVIPLGLAGGFFDALGGGGWGPLVTSTLVASGSPPRFTIGSVNTAEFFVTVAESITFILTIGLTHWKIILGLIAGGIIAAPLGAHLCRKIPVREMTIGVGILIILLSIRTLAMTLR